MSNKKFPKSRSRPATSRPVKPPPPPPPPPPPFEPRPKLRLAPLLFGGTVLYIGAAYVMYYVTTEKNKASKMAENMNDAGDAKSAIDPSTFDTQTVWDRIAGSYDGDIGSEEYWTGIGLMRRRLLKHAKGDVLEVSAGTGRNFPYYVPDQISSLTITDCNSTMLSEARSKFTQYAQKFHDTFVSFQTADAEHLDTITSPSSSPPNPSSAPSKYDTVIDTFGLCSCADPVAALVSFSRACRSSSSRILLLEHGRSHWKWLNGIMDARAPRHVERWGCWYNRDVMALLDREEVRKEVEVIYVRRWHFGTTCYVVARPRRTEWEEKGEKGEKSGGVGRT
ncbi:hypothetical protein BC938DRAFT_476826 [Jimgerdemannia flammicorona]|uniref:S-adenosyl-L-methionine-dependent methyltransferase n=1 Tax=Jimgerdemannia flammicorona TaxID=994334 RepID=A0A433QQ15_9FUNG|nr:hypothetical protein BC938DRAFT_476826 [Jimgerdemannia flammicorona]